LPSVWRSPRRSFRRRQATPRRKAWTAVRIGDPTATTRGTRQEGRHSSRDAKQDCKDAGGNRMECRHTKRGMKQDARKSAREKKYGDGKL
jgi:hypothetical protein